MQRTLACLVAFAGSCTAALAQPESTPLGALAVPSTTAAAALVVPAGQVVWYSFTIPDIGATNFFDINSAGAGDTEIGLYRADGTLVASDDDDGAGALSSLSFGAVCPPRANAGGVAGNGRDGTTLAAGTYYLALGFFNTTFNPTGFNVTSDAAATGPLSVNINLGEAGATPPAIVTDAGVFAGAEPRTFADTFTIAPGTSRWYRIELPEGIAATNNRFLDIFTESPTNVDTSIGLYSPLGVVVNSDTDDGPGLGSALSYGTACPTRPFPGEFGQTAGPAGNGRDAAALPAGVYYLNVSGATTTFNPCFAPTTTHTRAGEVRTVINFGQGLGVTLPTPSTIALGAISEGAPVVAQVSLAAGETKFYSFTVDSEISGASFLDIVASAASDLDIAAAVYRADATLEDSDADDGPGLFPAFSYGSGCPSRENNAGSPIGAGRRLGGSDGTLAAGTYFLALTGGPFTFPTSCAGFTSTSAVAGDFTLTITRGTSVAPTAPVATDLGTIGVENQGNLVNDAPLTSGRTLWYTFTIPVAAQNNDGNDYFFDIHTGGSLLSPGTNDTEIGLFTAAGALVDADDDDGPDLLSQLSYGDTASRPAIGNGSARTGSDGALAAGTYFLAVADFAVTFGSPGACPFNVQGDTAGGARTGTIDVTFITNIPGGTPPGNAACNIADIVSIGGFPPPDGQLTVDDYTSFINAFAGDELLADIVSIGGFPPPDGQLTVDDYTSFINAFAEGCPE